MHTQHYNNFEISVKLINVFVFTDKWVEKSRVGILESNYRMMKIIDISWTTILIENLSAYLHGYYLIKFMNYVSENQRYRVAPPQAPIKRHQ